MSISEYIIYKNNQLIALNKPVAIGVQGDQSDDKALIDLAEIYCQHRLHLIHRLDRPASGLVLFAKNKRALAHLNQQFQNRQVQKTYLAVVKNSPPKTQDQLTHFLRKQHHKNRSSLVEAESTGAKKASLEYKVIGQIDNYYLLEINLITGRHHQIRAQLAAIDCPIKGDVKYGFKRGNRDRSIHLHSWKLKFQHPASGEEVLLEAPLPEGPVWEAFGQQQ
ncbi:MAG: RNA pseudouridine synthase [Bacteroidota bacterium]